MTGTEKTFVAKLNKRPCVEGTGMYQCSMGAGMVGGIPDKYYEGRHGHLWVEFKHIKTDHISFNGPRSISPLQIAWLGRAFNNNQPVHVIVGVGLRQGFILESPREWNRIWSPKQYSNRLLSIDDIALYLTRITCGTR